LVDKVFWIFVVRFKVLHFSNVTNAFVTFLEKSYT